MITRSIDNMFLTHEELQEASGYKRAKMQIAWLRANGIPYVIDRWRRPKVLRSEFERRLGADTGPADDEPDFRHIRAG